jgi:hypothetical protein
MCCFFFGFFFFFDFVCRETKDPLREHDTPALFKNYLISAVKNMYGHVGAAVEMDVVQWDRDAKSAIVRTTKSYVFCLFDGCPQSTILQTFH